MKLVPIKIFGREGTVKYFGTDEDVLICVQRNLYNKYGKIEVQEIKVEFDVQYNIYDLIILVVMFLIYVPNNLVFKV